MDSAEFTEWQAFYLLEPFGGLVEDLRRGAETAVLANAHFGSAQKWYAPGDFMYGSEASTTEEAEPALIADPVAHSNLIRAAVFGIAPKAVTDVPRLA